MIKHRWLFLIAMLILMAIGLLFASDWDERVKEILLVSFMFISLMLAGGIDNVDSNLEE